jgi:HlyD family secretion protein
VRAGQTVSSGQALLSLSEDTSVMVVAQVQQADISKISVGQKARVGFGTELPYTTGEVISISVEAVTGTKSPTVPVNVKIANPDGIYRTGLTANVTFPMTGFNGEDASVSAIGAVAPLSKYDVKAEVSGTVQSIAVSQGDNVTNGQIVVEIKNDALVRAVKYAENDLIVARQSYNRIQQGYAPGVSDTDLKQAEFQIRQAETKLRVKAEAAAALEIRSPIDGVILSHALDQTASITAGNTLFVLADPLKMHMIVPVDELDVMLVKPGQKASITVDALPGRTLGGTVTKIGSEGTVKDGIATYDVTVTVDLPKDLKGSMTGTATIVTARKENVLTVPSEAVKSDGRRKYVTVVRNGAQAPVDVTTGLSGGKTVEIASGLQEGDTVVLSSPQQTQTNRQAPRPGGIIPGIK